LRQSAEPRCFLQQRQRQRTLLGLLQMAIAERDNKAAGGFIRGNRQYSGKILIQGCARSCDRLPALK